MRSLLLTCCTLAIGLCSQAQTFILPTATETVAPSFSGTISSTTCLLTSDVASLSNTDYFSVASGSNTVKLAAWSLNSSLGGGASFCFGYDNAMGVPLITYADTPIYGAIDIHIGFLENVSFTKTYAILSYYSLTTNSYMYNLYQLSSSSATLVETKTLMSCAYDRISMDVTIAKSPVFVWSDGTSVYTAAGTINAATNKIDFSASLAAPGIKLTGGSYNHTLPDVAIRLGTSTDTVYYTWYNDSAAQVDMATADLDDLLTATSSAYTPLVQDRNTVSRSTYTELDVPDHSTQNVWAYTYVDSYVKVRHKALSFGPVTATINNGSLTYGPAAMSVSGADFHPVIAFPDGNPAFYSLGWSTTRNTNPYAYPSGSAMVFVRMYAGKLRDSLASKKDYQLINSFPGATSPVYALPLVSFSQNVSSTNKLYATYIHASPGYSPWAELVHKNHLLSNNNSFREAAPSADASLTLGPNPSSSNFQLISRGNLDPAQQMDITLTDMTGRRLLQYTGILTDANAQLKSATNDLATGTYIITAAYADQRQEFKVQKTDK